MLNLIKTVAQAEVGIAHSLRNLVLCSQNRALPIKKNSGPIMPMPLIKRHGYPASRNGQGSLGSTYFNIG